jgi:hypothetical protein
MPPPRKSTRPAKRGRPRCGVSVRKRDRQRAAIRRANKKAAALNILIPSALMDRLKVIARNSGKPVWELSLEALEEEWIKDCVARGHSSSEAREDIAKWRGEFERGLRAARKKKG